MQERANIEISIADIAPTLVQRIFEYSDDNKDLNYSGVGHPRCGVAN
jgi:hypothetical protein